jgi:hypothetical protein
MASDHEGGQLTQTYSKRDGEIEDGRRHLILALDGDVEFELSFDLQNQTSSTFKSIPLREACTSFRTPNLEREVSSSNYSDSDLTLTRTVAHRVHHLNHDSFHWSGVIDCSASSNSSFGGRP